MRVVPDEISVAPERVVPSAMLSYVSADTFKLLMVEEILIASPLPVLLDAITLAFPIVTVPPSVRRLSP